MRIINNIIKNRFLDKNFKKSRYELLKYSIRYGIYDNIAYSYLYLYNLDKVNYVIYFHKNKISLGKIIECICLLITFIEIYLIFMEKEIFFTI